MEGFEQMTARECWERYGWGCEAKRGTMVEHGFLGGFEVFVDEINDSHGGSHACEIYRDGDMAGQWFDSTPEDALRGAMVEAVGFDVLEEEDNCEDAVNGCAYEAYQAIHGKTPMWKMDIAEMDELLGHARRFVKEQGKYHGIEWEGYEDE